MNCWSRNIDLVMVPGVWGTEEGVKEGKGGLPDS